MHALPTLKESAMRSLPTTLCVSCIVAMLVQTAAAQVPAPPDEDEEIFTLGQVTVFGERLADTSSAFGRGASRATLAGVQPCPVAGNAAERSVIPKERESLRAIPDARRLGASPTCRERQSSSQQEQSRRFRDC